MLKPVMTIKNPVCAKQSDDLVRLTLLHAERPKLYTILAFLSAVELNVTFS